MERPANSLTVLQRQLDDLYPNRTKPDWLKGDAAHAARKSDHNPNSKGHIQAIDIREGGGLNDRLLADRILASHDPRIKYVISEGRIGSSYPANGSPAWAWRPYTGENSHSTHLHVSVVDDEDLYDDISPWNITGGVIPEPLPKFDVANSAELAQMARVIIGYEDHTKPYTVYTVSDGSREIVGINQKVHPDYFAKVAAKVGNDEAVVQEASQFIIDYTNQAAQWTFDSPVEFLFRDCIFHRGPKGAAIIIQKAVNVEQDGIVGPQTKAAIRKMSVDEILGDLRVARETYEFEKYGKREKLWNGLVNRWNKAQQDAKLFIETDVPVKPEPVPTTPGIPPMPGPIPPLPPLPPPSVDDIDWAKMRWAYSLDRERLIALLKEALMLLDTPDRIAAAEKTGKTATQLKEEEQEMTLINTPSVAVEVVPFYRKRTFWLGTMAAVSSVLALITKNTVIVPPDMQSIIVDILVGLAGSSAGGAVYTASTSATVTRAGAEKARNA